MIDGNVTQGAPGPDRPFDTLVRCLAAHSPSREAVPRVQTTSAAQRWELGWDVRARIRGCVVTALTRHAGCPRALHARGEHSRIYMFKLRGQHMHVYTRMHTCMHPFVLCCSLCVWSTYEYRRHGRQSPRRDPGPRDGRHRGGRFMQ